MIKNELGFSLMEMMIAAGIMCFIALGISNLFVNQNNSAKLIEGTADLVGVNTNILQVILNPTVCNLSFLDAAGALIKIPNPGLVTAAAPLIIDHINLSGVLVAQTGQPPSGYKITSISFNGNTHVSTVGTVSTDLLNLNVAAIKMAGSSGYSVPWSQNYSVTVSSDSSTGGTITACGAGSGGGSPPASGPGGWTCQQTQGPVSNAVASLAICPATYQVISGGCVGVASATIPYFNAATLASGWQCDVPVGGGSTAQAIAFCCH